MSTDENSQQRPDDDSRDKEKYLEALERKKKSGSIRNNNIAGGPKISGGQSGANSPKMFRRKSGSS